MGRMRSLRFLVMRRLVQIGLLALFILGNYALLELKTPNGIHQEGLLNTQSASFEGVLMSKENFSHLLSGNLSFSKVLDTIPLSDPFATLQLFVAGGSLALDVWIGALIISLFYGVFAGRAYCGWVCPINPITDLSAWLRRRFALKTSLLSLPRGFKYLVLLASLILSVLFGVGAFEMINPVSMLHRGIVFGMGFGILGIGAIFLFDLFVLKNGFCGHICPIGATFSLIGKFSILKVKHNVQNCTKCMKCIEICPEKQVLDMVGKRDAQVTQMACLKCGRCIDVCADDALNFSILGGKNENT
ncbi:quinol dehydrogenase ferredoxin subunit NapH [Helicobacter pametensis]|uniref:quinol dehydrogenase ferredoxin subunit NapH n=1 Tax=Helicobacter pametensis TaxID=95149 RepID=UPI000480B6B4|nr:quinol dehydrogenase ferredoxin subunit NapH [Helicobacter pametensis]